jgi:hypothetical protein
MNLNEMNQSNGTTRATAINGFQSFGSTTKRDRHMIDGAKRKRRNGTKGEPRRIWYARWRAVRFAQRFGLCQIAGIASRAPVYRLVERW